MRATLLIFVCCLAIGGCSDDDTSVPAEGEVVTPPFEVSGDADGLLLVWFDEEGPHSAARRSEIPEANRASVRVDDLSLDPEQALDPDLVYVADLTSEGQGGRYVVRRMPRDAFDAQIDEATGHGAAEPSAAAGDNAHADVILYSASWCSACRATAAFFRERNIEFVERDIEREPGAREAMNQAARAAGVSPRGIPVIDFRGEIITGFDRGALERAIARSGSAI